MWGFGLHFARTAESRTCHLVIDAAPVSDDEVAAIVPPTAVPAGFAERLGREVFEELGAIGEGAIRRLLASLPAGFSTAVSDGIVGGFRRRLKARQEPT